MKYMNQSLNTSLILLAKRGLGAPAIQAVKLVVQETKSYEF
jgi:hypothetical protein